MRNAFAAEVTEIANANENVVLLSGDIGNKLFDRYKEVAPDRFFNCGIAEANMIGTAAGMAMCGLKPIVYTIVPFITTRCLEQIKIDLCYHNAPVVVVGVGGGLSYAGLGATHHSFEDIAILRVLPRMKVVCPGDPVEVRLAVRAALESDTPVYIRLGKKGEKPVHQETPDFEIGKCITVREGHEVCILSTGNLLSLAMACSDALELQSIGSQVVSFHTVKPLDESALDEFFSRFRLVVTLEEHSLIGGFGSAVSDWKNRCGGAAELITFGLSDKFLCEGGNQAYAREQFGLTIERIVPSILTALKRVVI